MKIRYFLILIFLFLPLAAYAEYISRRDKLSNLINPIVLVLFVIGLLFLIRGLYTYFFKKNLKTKAVKMIANDLFFLGVLIIIYKVSQFVIGALY